MKVCDIIIKDEVNPFLRLETREVKMELEKAKKLNDPVKVLKVVGSIDRLV